MNMEKGIYVSKELSTAQQIEKLLDIIANIHWVKSLELTTHVRAHCSASNMPNIISELTLELQQLLKNHNYAAFWYEGDLIVAHADEVSAIKILHQM